MERLLLLVGDVMLGRLVNEALKKESVDYPWGNTLSFFNQADLNICNLECVISDRGRPWNRTPKTFHFRSDGKNLGVLQKARIDVVSLANNHSLDFEEEALEEEICLLREGGIYFAGAGRNLEAASRPAFIPLKDFKVGFLSFTDNEPEWEARPGKPGILFVPVDQKDPRALRFFRQVEISRSQCDFLIVSAHWGPNHGYRPIAKHPPFAHALIDAGADLVFGHSCHVFQGIEFYREKAIFYSTGNFIDDYAIDPNEPNDESFLFMVKIASGKIVGLEFRPTIIADFQARLPHPRRAQKIAQKMIDLCRDFGTTMHWNEGSQILEAHR